MTKLGKFAAACAAVVCEFSAEAALPAEYQEVEYIESTGTQYINTEIAPKANTRVVVDVAFTEAQLTGAEYFGWGSSANQETFLFGADKNGWYINISKNWSDAFTPDKPFDNERHVFDLASGSQKFDGTEYGTSAIDSTATSTQYLYLFGSHVEWGATLTYPAKARLYSCKIYEGENLVCDYVPCYEKKENGAIGLYDTVGKKFCKNAGSGTFSKGKDKGADRLQVTCDPAGYGSATPDVGAHDGYVAGTDYTLTAPANWTSEDERSRAVCVGCAVSVVGGEVIASETFSGEGDTRSITYKHPESENGVEAVWQWAVENKVTVAAGEGGTVSKSEEWVASGGIFTVTAEPTDDSHTFYRWRDAAGNTVSREATLTLPITEPIDLTAEFGGVYYVATTGSDENDGLSPETAKCDPGKLIKAVSGGSTIYIAAGTYVLPDAGEYLLIDKAVTICGQGETATDVVIKPDTTTAIHRLLCVSNENAVVENVTFTGCQMSTGKIPEDKDRDTENTRRSPFLLRQGTLKDCRFVANSQIDYGTVSQSGGLITGCVFDQNKSYSDKSHSRGHGGGLYMTGGVTTNCTFTANKTRVAGGGAFVRGGLFTDCVVMNNSVDRHTGSGLVVAGGTVERLLASGNSFSESQWRGGAVSIWRGEVKNSVIRDNVTAKTVGGGVVIAGPYDSEYDSSVTFAKLTDSLVIGNTAAAEGGGVYLTYSDGIVDGCTVVGNTSAAGSGGGICQTAGTVKNTVAFGNVGGDFLSTGGTMATSCTDQNPLFVDAENGDYALRPGSPAIGTGLCDDGVTARDMGCVPYKAGEGDIICGFTVSQEVLAGLGSVTLKGFVDGEDAEGLTLKWDFDGDGVADATGAEVEFQVTEFGSYTITLWAEDAGGNRSGAYTRENVVVTLATKVYVNEQSTNPKSPYATPETAARDLAEALAALLATDEQPGEVIVADGTYKCPDIWYIVDRPIYLHSVNGPGKTFLQGWRSGSSSANYRVLKVDNEKAFVTGFTIEKGKWDSYPNGDEGTGGLRLLNGTVSNCVIRANDGNDFAGGVKVSGGLLTHCEIYGNKAYRSNNGGAGNGGGVGITGGTMQYCVISNNVACNNGAGGCGVKMTGNAVVRNCLIADNRGNQSSTTGIGVYMSAGTMECCTIIGNGVNSSSNSKQGGGVQITGGTLRNCLITGNQVTGNGAGVCQTGGTVENCTIAGNRSSALTGSGIYLAGGNAVCRNNIIFGNGAGVASEAICNLEYSSAKTFANNIVDPADKGTDNSAKDPLFKAAATGDYTLAIGSPAIDAATEQGLTEDLNGNRRPKDGNGDGTEAPDIGCYEAPGADEGEFSCAFDASVKSGYDEVTTVFTASVGGEGSKGAVTYDWATDGGEIVGTEEDGRIVTVKYTTYGYHRPKLTATAESGATAEFALGDPIAVGAKKLYVNTTGSGVWPYATPETATNDLVEVVNSALYVTGQGLEIEVDDGEYAILDKWVVLSGIVHLYSKHGAAATTLRGANPEAGDKRKVLHVNNADAIIEGFTFSGGWWDNYKYADDGGVVRLSAGVLRDCVFRDNLGGDNAGGVDVLGGTLTGCEFYNNESYRDSNAAGQGRGAAMTVSGPAFVADCVMSNNCAGVFGGGLWLKHKDAVVSNCTIVANIAGYSRRYKKSFTSDTHKVGGVQVDAGTLVNSTIADNMAYYDIGGALLNGADAKMVNCLVVRNAGLNNVRQGVHLANGAVLNCTIADNGTNKVATGSIACKADAGSLVNTIVAGNPECATELNAAAGVTVSHCQVGGDPRFKNARRGDYRFFWKSSPCFNAGDSEASGLPSVDLRGQPRVQDGCVDIGCYEIPQTGIMLIVR